MSFLVPLSKDDLIKHEVHGVTYLLCPPIGSTEREIKKIQNSVFNIKPYIPEAQRIVDEERKGKKWKRGERLEIISDKAAELAEISFLENFTADEADKRTDQLFDLICVGWEGENVTKFPGSNPSEYVVSAVKTEIVDWYQKQMEITPDEVKN